VSAQGGGDCMETSSEVARWSDNFVASSWAANTSHDGKDNLIEAALQGGPKGQPRGHGQGPHVRRRHRTLHVRVLQGSRKGVGRQGSCPPAQLTESPRKRAGRKERERRRKKLRLNVS